MKTFQTFLTEQGVEDLDVRQSKAIQALSELRDSSQDAKFVEAINNMIAVIQTYAGIAPKDGPYGTQMPHQTGEVGFNQSNALMGDQIPLQ